MIQTARQKNLPLTQRILSLRQRMQIFAIKSTLTLVKAGFEVSEVSKAMAAKNCNPTNESFARHEIRPPK